MTGVLLKRGVLACLLWCAGLVPTWAECNKPVYLSFDTGHMGIAPLVADVLQRNHVPAAFFLANEPTMDHGNTLDDHWAPWWKSQAVPGNVFGSHTYDHVYWLADKGSGQFLMRPSAGPQKGHARVWQTAEYCAELDRVAKRFEQMTGQKMSHLFRAPGGKTSLALLEAAKECGYRHVGWAPAGFLGDELSSDRYPNALLLQRALSTIRSGDILMAHLGIWSRQDPWAPAVLEPLIVGLKDRGFCFSSLNEHPDFREQLRATQ